MVTLAILVGIVVGFTSLPTEQAAQGLRSLCLPFLAAITACALTVTDLRWIMRCLTPVVCASAVAAVVQHAAGKVALIEFGLNAGTTVRTYEGILRASGLSLTNYHLGSFSAVFLALAAIWWFALETSFRERAWVVAGMLGSLICLAASVYRTGFLVVLLSIVMWLLGTRAGTAGVRIFAAVSAICAVFLVKALGFDSTSSLDQRYTNWGRIVDRGFRFLGEGVGSAGAGSASSFALDRLVTDNYFLHIFVQFGYVGLLLIAIVLVWTARVLIRSGAAPLLHSGYVLVSAIAAFWFVEFWEYSSAMMLVLSASTASYSIFMAEASARNALTEPNQQQLRAYQGELSRLAQSKSA